MKKDLVNILVCPVCKSSLELSAEKEKKEEVVSGALICKKCDHSYPVEDGIPNLLPPEFS